MDRRKSFGNRGIERRIEARQGRKQEPPRIQEAPKKVYEPRPSIIRKDLGSPSFWDFLKRLLKIEE
jgi:hypothetical protein